MDLAQYTRVVVSTGMTIVMIFVDSFTYYSLHLSGGGIVLKQENWGLLRHGIVVYLDVAPEVILSRLDSNQVLIRMKFIIY